MGDDGVEDNLRRLAAQLDARLAALRADIDIDHERLRTARAPVPVPPARPPAPKLAPLPTDPIRVEIPVRRKRLARTRSVLVAVVAATLFGLVLAVTVGPLVLPYRVYAVRSGSMEPAVPTGAVLVVTEADADGLGPGDVITFARPGGTELITHRIVAVEVDADGRAGFVTKGDANAVPDPWLVPASATVHRLRFQVPLLGHVFGWLATAWVRVVLVVGPLSLLAVVAVRARRATAD